MFTSENIPYPVAIPRRTSYPESSRTIQHADQRTRELADAMLRLNAEDTATETALLREGFSAAELRHHSPAATQIANHSFVRQVAEAAGRAPLKTDDELLAIALDRVGGLVDEGQIVAALRGANSGHDPAFTCETIARLWPRLCAPLATPLRAAGQAGRAAAPARGGVMGKGINAAREHAPEHAALIDDLKDQLLIVFLKRLRARGDDLRFPVAEVDDTGSYLLAFKIDGRDFVFELSRKS